MNRAAPALTRAQARIDTLGWYPRPVDLRRVRLVSTPWLVRLPADEASDDLVCHELCHVWQMQHHPLRMPLSYLGRGYARNPYEMQARRAVALTRE